MMADCSKFLLQRGEHSVTDCGEVDDKRRWCWL